MQAFAIAQLDGVASDAFFRRVREVVECGVDLVQLRAPSLSGAALADAAVRCRAIVGPNTRLVIGRRADIAAVSGAHGVHLPAAGVPAAAVRSVNPALMVGRSCHSLEGVRAAAEEGVDYVYLGPVFAPRSKAGVASISPATLAEASRIGPRVYALGGISAQNVASLAGTGIAGVAAITMFMNDRPLGPILEVLRSL